MRYAYKNIKNKDIGLYFYNNSFDLVLDGRFLIYDKFNNISKLHCRTLYDITKKEYNG